MNFICYIKKQNYYSVTLYDIDCSKFFVNNDLVLRNVLNQYLLSTFYLNFLLCISVIAFSYLQHFNFYCMIFKEK